MTRPARDPRPRRLAAPLAPVAIAFAAGIVADRFGPGWPTSIWLILAVVPAVVAMIRPAGVVGFVATALAFAALGGARHHRSWSDLDRDDLARQDWTTPRPAWLRGAVVEVPSFHADERAEGEGSTRTILAVEGIHDGRRWHAASGSILLYISADRTDLEAGDPVFAAGSLGAIAGPRNPGEGDARERWRAEGIRLRMGVGEATGVWPDPETRPRPFARWLGRVRSEGYRRLVAGVDPKVAPLAAALVLGRREAVDPNVNDAFARTGTTHLLAISGLQLQALAIALGWALRPFFAGYKKVLVVVAVVTVLYAGVVGFMPSVVRAMTMTVAVCLAGLCDRCSRPANLLAIAALATLALNPAFLFDAGCQLSFLCVGALVWGVDPALRAIGLRVDPADPKAGPEDPAATLDALERKLEPRGKKAARRLWRWGRAVVVASAVLWAVTLPLTALRFHLVSPIAILWNVPLIPLTVFAMFAAGIGLLASLAWAPLGVPFAWSCSKLLWPCDDLVRWGSAFRWGHAFVAGPAWGWVVGFYALLAAGGWASSARWRLRRWIWGVLAMEALMAVVAASVVATPSSPEAEVLAVDHGLCVVVRSVDGRAWLYDCGKMRDPRIGRRVIAPYLWSQGIRRIDGVILSHADNDHYNGLPDLLDRFRIGEVLVAAGFGGPKNPEAGRLLDLVRSRGVPVRTLVAGDAIRLGEGCSAEVLHPAEGWLPSAPDNDRSVVLDLGDASGHHLVLTGDLEGAGLPELLAMPKRPIDVLLAPHHGGRSANPERLYAWAGASRVVVSQRRPAGTTRDPLAAREGRGLPVARTWKRGAIRIRFAADGPEIRGFLDDPPPPTSSQATNFASFGSRGAASLIGAAAGLGLCLALAVIEWGAWTLVLPGRRLGIASVEPPPWEPIEARAGEGVVLSGAWLGTGRSGPTIVFVHGFGEDRSAMLGRAALVASLGRNAAVLDSRGRGGSEGDRTSFGGREASDLVAWLDVLALRAGPDPRFVAWGRSMGAAVALRAAAEDPRIVALILEAPYADLRDTVAATLRRMRISGKLAGPMLGRAARLAGISLHRPRPIDLAPLVRVPTLILHGTADPIVPKGEAQRLAAAIAGPVEVETIAGAGHNNVFEAGGTALADRVAAFLDDHL